MQCKSLNGKFRIIFLTLSLIIVILHLLGFKIFGKASLVNNQPLKNPEKISGISTQGNIVLANGQEYDIYGITTILPNPLEQIRYFKLQMPTLEVEIESPEQKASRVWAKNKILYWCGNTWMPQLFPPRLPTFSKIDLGKLLVRYGGAIPDISVFEESPEYAQELMKAISGQVSDLVIEQKLESTIRLGEYLVESQPEYFREGAWLLALNNKSEIFDTVKEKVNEMINEFEERKKRPGFYAGDTRKDIIDFAYILMKLSEDRTKQFLLGHIQSEIDVYLRVHMGTVLLSIDDYGGYDILMDELMKPGVDSTIRAGLNHEMDVFLSNRTPGEYYPYGDAQKMYDWYQRNKEQLHWDNKRWHMSYSNKL